MRIVYLSASGQLGGAERCLLDVLQSVRQEEPGWSLTLVASRQGPLLSHAAALGVETRVLQMPERIARLGDATTPGRGRRLVGVMIRGLGALTGLISYRRELRALLKQLNPDVVHTNGYKMHIMGALSRPARAALCWHLHDYASSRPLMSIAVKTFSRRCDAGIAVSRSVAADVSPYWRGRGDIHVVLNAVDLDVFQPDGPQLDLDALAGLRRPRAEVVRVGLVATMGRFKGHDVFLRAMAQLPPDAAVRGYVVGGSLYETHGSEWSMPALRDLADSLGLADRVGFTGFVGAPADAMRALDVVVHASTSPEPFGLVIAEAMACGRAVITSAAGGAGEIVASGVDALTCTPGSVDELAAAITRLCGDAALRRRLGAAARAHAVRAFDRRRLGQALAPIYRDAAAGRGPRPKAVA